MPLVIYKPEAGGDPVTTQYGYVFDGSPVEVNNTRHLAKFNGSPFFEVIEGEGGTKSPPSNLVDFDGNGTPGGSVAAVTGVKAVHKGRGKYAVVKDGSIIEDGLTKEEATAKAAELSAAG